MKAKHELKIDQEYFKAVKDGKKKFEIRKNDRDYKVGDILVMLEYDKYYEAFTGEKITVEISYLTGYAQQDGYLVLGIEGIWEDKELTEIKKVVIPKFVAEWLAINKLSSDLIQLYEEVEYATDSDGFIEGKWDYSGELYDWIVGDTDNIYKLSDALRYGYEIEKEKLYYVELPEKKETLNARVLKKHPNREIGFGLVDKLDLKTATQIRLTEQEIKSIDERYWAFAVEVEG